MFIMVQSDVSTKARAPFMLQDKTFEIIQMNHYKSKWIQKKKKVWVQTSSTQPRPKTAPVDSRRCCLPVACQTFLKQYICGLIFISCTYLKTICQEKCVYNMNTHLSSQFCHCSSHGRMMHWFWEIHHEAQQTCCHLVPKQKQWCSL